LVLTEQFLPVRAVLLEDYWRKTAEKWHFAEMGYSSASNNFGGFYNASNHPNLDAFAILQADGSIMAWGSSSHGGTGAPSGSDYTKIYSNGHAFAVHTKGHCGNYASYVTITLLEFIDNSIFGVLMCTFMVHFK
jgi:hypothetical protein